MIFFSTFQLWPRCLELSYFSHIFGTINNYCVFAGAQLDGGADGRLAGPDCRAAAVRDVLLDEFGCGQNIFMGI